MTNIDWVFNGSGHLKVGDLAAVLDREDHHGWGYATRRYLDAKLQRELDAAVIEVANALMISCDDLFEWADSKWGRWLVDAVQGRDEPATVETVRGCLNKVTLADLGIDVTIEEQPAPQVELSARDAGAIAEALELLAGIDEGENTDYEDLMRLSRLARDIARAGKVLR
jgi:hypothetical protein